jgi:hypothetical protein
MNSRLRYENRNFFPVNGEDPTRHNRSDIKHPFPEIDTPHFALLQPDALYGYRTDSDLSKNRQPISDISERIAPLVVSKSPVIVGQNDFHSAEPKPPVTLKR